MKKPLIMVLFTATTFIGCATQTGWTPVVDTYNNPNANRIFSRPV